MKKKNNNNNKKAGACDYSKNTFNGDVLAAKPPPLPIRTKEIYLQTAHAAGSSVVLIF